MVKFTSTRMPSEASQVSHGGSHRRTPGLYPHQERGVGLAVAQFCHEWLGRGPEHVVVYQIWDMIVVRLRGVLTPVEHTLATQSAPEQHSELIQKLRHEILKCGDAYLRQMIRDIVGVEVKAVYSDIHVVERESVYVFVLDHPLVPIEEQGQSNLQDKEPQVGSVLEG